MRTCLLHFKNGGKESHHTLGRSIERRREKGTETGPWGREPRKRKTEVTGPAFYEECAQGCSQTGVHAAEVYPVRTLRAASTLSQKQNSPV